MTTGKIVPVQLSGNARPTGTSQDQPAKQPRTITPAQIYGEAGLIYIKYGAKIEATPNGHKKTGGSRPAYSKIQKQLPYEPEVATIPY